MTDTLPPPDGVIHGDVAGFYANKDNGYTVATVRHLLAERDARIDALTAALRKCVDELQTRRNSPNPRPVSDWLMSAAETDARKLLEDTP